LNLVAACEKQNVEAYVLMVKPEHTEDTAVWTARREALVVLLILLAALIYTVTACYMWGYNRSPQSLTFIFGFPDWVFWGIVVPWVICLGLSYWFGYIFMRDADLGSGEENGSEDLEDDYA
jgi:hypothetical protein